MQWMSLSLKCMLLYINSATRLSKHCVLRGNGSVNKGANCCAIDRDNNRTAASSGVSCAVRSAGTHGETEAVTTQ
jgi:hypothetical protein